MADLKTDNTQKLLLFEPDSLNPPTRKTTTFVNEFVPEADIEKYHLKEMKLQANPFVTLEDLRKLGFRFHWTVDRERDLYLMLTDGLGREKYYMDWVLYVHGQLFKLWLARPGGNRWEEDDLFHIYWELQGISPDPGDATQRSRILSILEEALTVYGMRGVYEKLPETTVATLKLSTKLSDKFSTDRR